jgi:cytosine permease
MLLNLKDNKRAKATMAAGILGTLLAIVGAINFFESFLYWVGYTFTPVAGIMMADYYIIRKGNPKNWHPVKNVDWLAITSWVLGILITTRVPSPLPIVTGLIASMLLFVLLKKLVPNTAINKESIDIE